MSNQAGGTPLARKYAEWAVRNRVIIGLIVLVATVTAAFFVPSLDVRNDPDTLLPPRNKYVATNDYAEQNFGMGNIHVVGIRIKDPSQDIYQPWFFNLLQEMEKRLIDLPYSRGYNFMSIASKKIRYMGLDEEGSLMAKRLMPVDGVSEDDPELAAEQLAFLKEGVEENPVIAPMMITKEDANGKCAYIGEDGKNTYYLNECRATAAYVIGDYTDEVKAHYLEWVTEMVNIHQEYEAKYGDRVEILVAGEPYFLAYMLYDLVQKWWLFVISLAIVIAILWFEFRNWRGALFPMAGVGATIIMTLGVMGYSQFKLTTMMVLTPMLLLAIGIGHSVQILRRFMLEQSRQGDAEKAAVVAIEHTIIPATLSIVTDCVGFATLGTVDISFYKAYAYFGMFGMFTLLITTTTLIPLLMVMFRHQQQAAGDLEEELAHGWEAHLGNFMTGLIQGPGKVVPVAFIVVLFGLSTYYTNIFNWRGWDVDDGEHWYLEEGDPMPGVERAINYPRAAFKAYARPIIDMLRLGELMPGVLSVNIPFRSKEPLRPACWAENDPPGCWDEEEMGAQGAMTNPEVVGAMIDMEKWMRTHPYVGFTGSFAQFIRIINMLLDSDEGTLDLAKFEIPTKEFLLSVDPDDDRDPKEIMDLYNGLLELMTEAGDMDAFVKPDWTEGVILGFINTINPRETHKVTADILQYIEEHKNDKGMNKVNFGLRVGPGKPIYDLSGNLVEEVNFAGDTNELSVEGENYVRPGVGGFLGATEATRDVSQEQWLRSPFTTAVAIFIIAALMFRSVIVSVLLSIILLITLYAQYGMAGYLTSVENWSGNLAFHTLTALSIAMGLGVDYSIYMVSRLREEMAQTGGSWAESLRNTLQTTGSAVVISVIVLLGSFIPLVSTQLANTWVVAVYIGEALVIDVVTALLFLPLLVYWIKPKYVFEPNS